MYIQAEITTPKKNEEFKQGKKTKRLVAYHMYIHLI